MKMNTRQARQFAKVISRMYIVAMVTVWEVIETKERNEADELMKAAKAYTRNKDLRTAAYWYGLGVFTVMYQNETGEEP